MTVFVEAPSPPLPTEGAGVVSSWADLAAALTAERVDPVEVVFAAGAAGLDTLGMVLHPFDGLLRAGFGWLLEHIGFLREPLDALAGDPDEVRSQARAWDHVSRELRAAADDYRSVVPVPDWEGAAAAGYQHTVEGLVGALEAGADQADALSRLILVTGAAVGTARALIRDMIAKFVAAVVQYLLAGAALAVLSSGGSLATMVIAVIVRALEVAEQIKRRIGRLLDLLDEAGATAARISAALRHSADRINAAAPAVRASMVAADRAAGDAHVRALVEAGKQATSTAHYQATWPGHAR